jgi:hypothetical protein
MKFKDIIITHADGKKYAKQTGDKNLIHTDEISGYNSIYGEKVCHGSNVLDKFLKIFLKKKRNHLKYIFIKFNKHLSYNKKIKIIKKKNNEIHLIQKKIHKATIFFGKEIKNDEKLNIKLKKYKYFTIKKVNKNISNEKRISKLLGRLSYHVGMIFPGKNSIINSILIYNYIKKDSIKDGIYTKIIKEGYPFVKNYLKSENILIEFETLVRPSLKILNIKINRDLLGHIKKLENRKIFIIGGSGGIGTDLIKIFINNKNIKIFASYFKNKITIKNKNIHPIEINILKDQKKVINFINKENIDFVYYLPTPKISLYPNREQKNLYEKMYIKIPLEILKNINKNSILNFFYPSTFYIDNKNKDSYYAKVKFNAEKKLINIAKKSSFIKLSMPRLPQLNTKQNLNILNLRFPTLIKLLNKNKKLQKYFF